MGMATAVAAAPATGVATAGCAGTATGVATGRGTGPGPGGADVTTTAGPPSPIAPSPAVPLACAGLTNDRAYEDRGASTCDSYIDNEPAGDCAEWVSGGECETDPWIASYGCQASCCELGYDVESDHDDDCNLWASAGECDADPDMLVHCQAACCAVLGGVDNIWMEPGSKARASPPRRLHATF